MARAQSIQNHDRQRRGRGGGNEPMSPPPSALAFVLRALLTLAEGVWWFFACALFVGRSLGDIVHLVRVLHEGSVRCPRGHVVPTSGETYRCACGFAYEGSIWLCPHCKATTAFCSCPTCGLSTPNPYRSKED